MMTAFVAAVMAAVMAAVVFMRMLLCYSASRHAAFIAFCFGMMLFLGMMFYRRAVFVRSGFRT